jgi:hypothetical protein
MWVYTHTSSNYSHTLYNKLDLNSTRSYNTLSKHNHHSNYHTSHTVLHTTTNHSTKLAAQIPFSFTTTRKSAILFTIITTSSQDSKKEVPLTVPTPNTAYPAHNSPVPPTPRHKQ